MKIFAEITGLKYQIHCADELSEITFEKFDINKAPSSCKLTDKNFSYGVSKWVSPKRTRSYPFERIYNTLIYPKRITVIPVIKDEGARGDRDFIQWDTISLMSLLDVYVILAHYSEADKHPSRYNKITNQRFDANYINEKIIEINSYHSSALHWNLKEIKDTLPTVIGEAQKSYSNIGQKLSVSFHGSEGIERFKEQFLSGVDNFMETSRNKARDAQSREQHTIQPKELLSTETKATITIKNYLGGLYYLTTDEALSKGNVLFLIEGKHSHNSSLPSIGDIKDGLLKMMLYCNLKNVRVATKHYVPKPVLKLTSTKIKGEISSSNKQENINRFFQQNEFRLKQVNLIENLFHEGKINGISIRIEGI